MSTFSPPSAPPAGSHVPHAVPADARSTQQETDQQTAAALSVPFDEDLHGTPLPPSDTQDQEEEAGGGDEDDDNDDDLDDDEEALPYPQPHPDEPIAHPPDFRPFFTLIEDASSGEHHHPTVHYIFTDDDPDLLTNAALDTLNHEPEAPADHIQDRFVILDLLPDGKEITSATSLSPEWQALEMNISPAPSWGKEDGSATDRGLMLKISGREANVDTMTGEKKRKGDVEGLLKVFDEQLHSLDGVLGSEEVGLDVVDT